MIPFHLFWYPIVPVSGIFLVIKNENEKGETDLNFVFQHIFPVFVLISTEMYGANIKMSKYSYCVTFVFYESICFASIFICMYTLVHKSYIEMFWKLWQTMTSIEISFYISIFIILQLIMSGFIYFCQWIKNSVAHNSLCRSEVLEVSESA